MVRDANNRLVRGLGRPDFEVRERGELRSIVDFKARDDAPVSVAATEGLVAILRQHYFLAIDASTKPGWYEVEVRTRRPGLTVRARNGYLVSGAG